MKAINPGIVYCSMSAWGQDGPHAQKPAHDMATEAMTGALSLNLGADGRTPRNSRYAGRGHCLFDDDLECLVDGITKTQ